MSRNTATHPVTGAQIVYFANVEEYRNLLNDLQEAGSPILNNVGLNYEGSALASISTFLEHTVLRNGDTPNTSLGEQQIYDGAKGTHRGYTNGIYTGKGEASKLYLNITTDNKKDFFGPSINYKDQRNGDGGRLYAGLTQLIFAIGKMNDAEKLQSGSSLIDRVSAKFERGELSIPGYQSNAKTVGKLINDTLQFSMLKKINEQGREVALDASDIEIFAYKNKKAGNRVSIGVSPKANIPLSLDSVQKIEEYISRPLDERQQAHIENFPLKSDFSNRAQRRLGAEQTTNTLKDERTTSIVDTKTWETAFFLEKKKLSQLDQQGRLASHAQNTCRANDYIHGKYSEFHKNGINNVWQGYAQLIAGGKIFASGLSFPRDVTAASICHDIDNINRIKNVSDRKQAFLNYMSDSNHPVFCAYYQQTMDTSNLGREGFLAVHERHPGDTLIIPYSAMGDDGKNYYALQKIVPLSNDDGGYNNTKLTIKGNSFLGHHLFIRDYDSTQAAGCDRPTIILAEGLSTALAINCALDDKSAKENGVAVVSCASSSNMERAFERLANIYPNANFIVAADNDFGLLSRGIKRLVDNEFSGFDVNQHGSKPIKQLKSPDKDSTFAKALNEALIANTGIKYAEGLIEKVDGILSEKNQLTNGGRGKIGLMVPDATSPVSQISADSKGLISLPFATQKTLMEGLRSGTVPLSVLHGVAQSPLANTDYDDALRAGLKKEQTSLSEEHRHTEQGRRSARTKAWDDYCKNITSQINQITGLNVQPSKVVENMHISAPVRYKRSEELRAQMQAIQRAKSQKNKVHEANTEAGIQRLQDKLQQTWGTNKELYHQTVLALHGMGVLKDQKQVVGIKEGHLNKVVLGSLLTAAVEMSDTQSDSKKIYGPLMEEIIKDSQRNTHLLAKDTFEANQWVNIAKGFELAENLTAATGKGETSALFVGSALSPAYFGKPEMRMLKHEDLNAAATYGGVSQESIQAVVVASVVQGLVKANREVSSQEVDVQTATKITANLRDAIIKEGGTPPLVKSVLDTMHEMAKAGVYSSPEASDGFYKNLGQNGFCPRVEGESPQETLITSITSSGYRLSDACTDRLMNDGHDGISYAQDFKVGMNLPIVVRGYSDMYPIDNKLIRAQDALLDVQNKANIIKNLYATLMEQAPAVAQFQSAYHELLENHSFAEQGRTLSAYNHNDRTNAISQLAKDELTHQNNALEL